MSSKVGSKRLGILVLSHLFFCVTSAYSDTWKIQETYVLPNIGLSQFLAQPPLGLQNVEDHGIDLGGIGSDLWHGREDDGPGIYWMITDRGPNGEDPRTFPVPEFTPYILKVHTANGAIEILESIPITGLDQTTVNGVTGIPNLNNTAEPPALNETFYDCFGLAGIELATNPHGLDTEGIVHASDGTFWVVEEYGPSILKIASDGKVLRRFFPEDFLNYLAPITGYNTDDSSDSVPALFGLKRKLNRGLEGIGLSPDQQILYIVLQSPLVNPDTTTGNDSRNTRILAFDIASEQIVAEYVYRFQFTGPGTNDDEFDVPSLGTTGRARPRDMKLSAVSVLDDNRMLALERTDFKAKIFLIDLRRATNILGSSWDNVSTNPSLETLNADGALEDHGIVPVSKQFVLTLDSTASIDGIPIPQKIEGMTILDGKTIAIANDNDFGVGTFQIDNSVVPPTCTLIDSGKESQILVIRLEKGIK
jgi:Esterase-like activity of phytase